MHGKEYGRWKLADGDHKQPKHVVDDNLMYRALKFVLHTDSKHRHSL